MAGFRFLDLPPEIRNRIYFSTESLIATLSDHKQPRNGEEERVADGGNCVAIGCWFCRYSPIHNTSRLGDHIPFPSQPRITRVCRQIREETLPVFYGANGFIIEDWYWWEDEGIQTPFPKILLGWLNSIRHHLHLMTRVAILCEIDCVQREHEIVAMLTDQDLAFEDEVLKEYSAMA
jgi:hypothetical protein